MTYRKYYDPFSTPEIPDTYVDDIVEDVPKKELKIKHHKNNAPLGFLSRLRIDDIILIGILILMLFEDETERDLSVIFGIGFLLITELFD